MSGGTRPPDGGWSGNVMMWVLAAMVLLSVLLIVVAASWMRNLVRLDHELRNRAHHAALLLQTYDLADAATERAD